MSVGPPPLGPTTPAPGAPGWLSPPGVIVPAWHVRLDPCDGMAGWLDGPFMAWAGKPSVNPGLDFVRPLRWGLFSNDGTDLFSEL
jgi:hypothetical protein